MAALNRLQPTLRLVTVAGRPRGARCCAKPVLRIRAGIWRPGMPRESMPLPITCLCAVKLFRNEEAHRSDRT